MKILVTGAAGFIGSFTAERLAKRGDTVVGIDNLNDYYDVDLKRARLQRLGKLPGFSFEKVDIADRSACQSTFALHRPERIVHLAAQAGVRHSIEHPHTYVDANIDGVPEHPRVGTGLRCRPLGLRVDQRGLRRQYAHAL